MIELARTFKGRIKFVKIDARESAVLARKHKVMGVPAIFLYRDGVKIDEIRGKLPKEEFKRWLTNHL